MKTTLKGRNHLSILRLDKERTWSRIAKLLEIDGKKLSMMVYGQISMTDEIADKLAEYFGVNKTRFFE